MLPSFSDIAYFTEVAEAKNISRAAERLGITQPSLSTAIKRLEQTLGTALLIRNRTGVRPTKAGAEFLNKGRMLLLQWEQLRADINKNETSVSGQYVIGCHPSVALHSLPLFLPTLLAHHPDLEIKLVHDLSRKITEGVISFTIDFGIVVNPIAHPDLVIRELCLDDVSFWVAKKATETQALNNKNGILVCDLNLLQTQSLISQLQKRGLGFRRILQSSNLEVIAHLTASGVGVGILPSRVAKHFSSLPLKPLDSRLPNFRDKICLVYRADAQKTKGSQALIESIKLHVR